MSGVCAAVDTSACATRISNLNISGFTENTAHVSSTLRLFCIADRYQVSGVRYCSYSQYLDYCLFSGLSAIMRVQYASCSRSNLCVYCKLLSAAMPYIPLLLLLLLCCCWCCGWVCTAAAAATARSSNDACYHSCCCCCYFCCCAAAAIAFMCDAGETISSAQASLEVG